MDTIEERLVERQLSALDPELRKELVSEATQPDGDVDTELLALLGVRNNLARDINATLEGDQDRATLEEQYQDVAEAIATRQVEPETDSTSGISQTMLD